MDYSEINEKIRKKHYKNYRRVKKKKNNCWKIIEIIPPPIEDGRSIIKKLYDYLRLL